MHGARMDTWDSSAHGKYQAGMSLARNQGAEQGLDMLYEARWQAFGASRCSCCPSAACAPVLLPHLYPLPRWLQICIFAHDNWSARGTKVAFLLLVAHCCRPVLPRIAHQAIHDDACMKARVLSRRLGI